MIKLLYGEQPAKRAQLMDSEFYARDEREMSSIPCFVQQQYHVFMIMCKRPKGEAPGSAAREEAARVTGTQ